LAEGVLTNSLQIELPEINKYDFDAIPGDSGSLVFNKNYELVGLVFATYHQHDGLVIPISEITKMLKLMHSDKK
jgi:V8-like Glu-specific endopeptidase